MNEARISRDEAHGNIANDNATPERARPPHPNLTAALSFWRLPSEGHAPIKDFAQRVINPANVEDLSVGQWIDILDAYVLLVDAHVLPGAKRAKVSTDEAAEPCPPTLRSNEMPMPASPPVLVAVMEAP